MRTSTVLVCLALISIFIPVSARSVPESSFRWAERILAQASTPPTSPDYTWTYRLDCIDAEQAFTEVLRKYGPNGRAYLGLGRSQMLLGKYPQAVQSFEQAVRLSPSSQAKQGLSDVQTLASVAEWAREDGKSVLQVVRYPVPGDEAYWLVLSARVEKRPDLWPLHSDARLMLVGGLPGQLRRVWTSEILGYPGNTDGEFDDLGVHVVEMTGGGTPEVVIPELFIGGSWAPSHLDVFAWQNGQIVKVLGASSHIPLDVKDLNHDGAYEAITYTAIGWDLSHAEQPRWPDVYAWKRDHYELANGDFPSEYAGMYRDIRDALSRHPTDRELLAYMGDVYRIRHQPHSALRTYRRAEKVLDEWIKDEEDAELRAYFTNRLRYVRQRISSLEQQTSSH